MQVGLTHECLWQEVTNLIKAMSVHSVQLQEQMKEKCFSGGVFNINDQPLSRNQKNESSRKICMY